MERFAGDMAVTILLSYLVILGILAIGCIASYLLRGIGMYTLGKRRGMNYPWLAFIPYARTYFQGELCGTLHFKEKEIRNPGIWILVIPIVSNFVTGIFGGLIFGGVAISMARLGVDYSSIGYHDPGSALANMFSGTGIGMLMAGIALIGIISVLVGALVKTLLVLVNHQIFERYTDKNYALVHAVAGVFVPLYTSIYFFIIRNREE